MVTPTPTASQAELIHLQPLTTLDPTLNFVLHLITLIGALYGFVRIVIDAINWLRPARLKLYMSDYVWPVAEPSNSELAINIQFTVHNPGKRLAVLRRLEAQLERPAYTKMYPPKSFGLAWRHFIKGNPSGFEQTETVFAKPISAQDSEVIGVQLRGDYDRTDSLRPACFDWFPGDYTLHLQALVNNKSITLSPKSGFAFNISDWLSGDLSPNGHFNQPYTRPVQLK
jgi:hypothetical protein